MAANDVAGKFCLCWDSGVGSFLHPPWVDESNLRLRTNVTNYKEQTKHILQIRATGRLFWVATRKWWLVVHAVAENVLKISREQDIIRRVTTYLSANGYDSNSDRESDAEICAGEVASGGTPRSGADDTLTVDERGFCFITRWHLEAERLHGHGDGGNTGEDEPGTAD